MNFFKSKTNINYLYPKFNTSSRHGYIRKGKRGFKTQKKSKDGTLISMRGSFIPNFFKLNGKNVKGFTDKLNSVSLTSRDRKQKNIKMNNLKNLKWISWAETGEVDPFVYFLEGDKVPHTIENKTKKLKIENAEEFCSEFGEIISVSENRDDRISIFCIKNEDYFFKFYFHGLFEECNIYYTIYDISLERARKSERMLEEEFSKYRIQEDAGTNTYIVVKKYSSLDLEKAKSEVEVSIDKNYGKSFIETHQEIVEKIQKKNKGLYLFYGEPGSGKTNYIRHLSKELDKKFIFIPPCLFSSIDSPDFVSFLAEHKNSVLVFEDAENVIQSRDENPHNFNVSSILNIADGIVGDLLNLHIIITFNTDKEKVDKALLRKGRLSYIHEFKALEVDDANYFLEGTGIKVDKPTVLADLYNMEEETGHKKEEKKVMGFAP